MAAPVALEEDIAQRGLPRREQDLGDLDTC